MSDLSKCPNCGTDLRDEAKFCDNCGNPVSAEAAAAATPAVPVAGAPKVNWTGVVLVLALVAVVGWLLFGPMGGNQADGSGTTAANPHGTSMGGSSDSANPHGSQAGMEGLMQSLADAKAKLETDPLDRDALMTLYQNYGMVGKQASVRPYLDKAVTTLEAKSEELGDTLVETGMNIGLAALLGNELDGARAVYLKLNELRPGTPEVVSMLADVSAAMDNFEDAVKYYDEYLAAVSEKSGDQYWSAVINRAVALRMKYEKAAPGTAKQEWIADSIAGLEQAVLVNKDQFSPAYNLGVSYSVAGQKDKAIATLTHARSLAKDEMEQWQVDAEVAKLNGTEPPPQPAMDSTGMGAMSNPHGGTDMGGMGSAEGMPNPHAGMDMGGSGGGGSEGGMANPHGG